MKREAMEWLANNRGYHEANVPDCTTEGRAADMEAFAADKLRAEREAFAEKLREIADMLTPTPETDPFKYAYLAGRAVASIKSLAAEILDRTKGEM